MTDPEDRTDNWTPNCPVSSAPSDAYISLAHGEGARATRRLIQEHFLPRFGDADATAPPDAAHLSVAADQIAVSTDTFVVSPLFFPGGDIGSMAVFGTVNDLAVSGAVPKWLTIGLVIEEGFPFAELVRVLDSVAAAARQCDITIVAGDTKVVPRGAADGLFVNTTGIGEVVDGAASDPRRIRAGDSLIVSGPIGNHGIAILAARDQLCLEPPPQSDSAPLHAAVADLQQSVGPQIRAIRDATRGGVSAVLHEWAEACSLTMQLQESSVPVADDVRGACELLGLDPLYVANEGTMVLAVDPSVEAEAIDVLQQNSQCRSAACIGRVVEQRISPVTIHRMLGREQPLDEPSGLMLPRIC